MNNKSSKSSKFICPLLLLLVPGCSGASTSTIASNPAPTDPPPPQSAASDGDRKNDDSAKSEVEKNALADKLASWLAGQFDSKEQAARDESYFEISLRACKVSAPEIGPRALYVEQARVGSSPYRQRIYSVEPIDNGSAKSLVFELENASAMTGKCDEPEATRPVIAPKNVVPRTGCYVVMHWVTVTTNDDGPHFEGHTPDSRWDGKGFVKDPNGEKCESSLQGASYATSRVELHEKMLKSWDQGWNKQDQQVWGATKGPYEFVRQQ